MVKTNETLPLIFKLWTRCEFEIYMCTVYKHLVWYGHPNVVRYRLIYRAPIPRYKRKSNGGYFKKGVEQNWILVPMDQYSIQKYLQSKRIWVSDS